MTRQADSAGQVLFSCARRVRQIAYNVQEAQALGCGPGNLSISSDSFQRQAVPIYCKTLPSEFQISVARFFDRCATALDAFTCVSCSEAGSTTPCEWDAFRRYVTSVSQSIAEYFVIDLDVHVTALPTELAPAAVRFCELGQMASAASVEALAGSSSAVLRSLESAKRLTDTEQSLVSGLLAGKSMRELASELGYSERTLHRRLSALWERLGAPNKQRGLALLVEQLPMSNGS